MRDTAGCHRLRDGRIWENGLATSVGTSASVSTSASVWTRVHVPRVTIGAARRQRRLKPHDAAVHMSHAAIHHGLAAPEATAADHQVKAAAQ